MQRPRIYTVEQLTSMLVQLGVPFVEARMILQRGNLEKLKEEVKKRWKQIAFDLHPDRNNGDDEEFKKVKQIYDVIMSMRIPTSQEMAKIIRPQQGVRIVIHQNWNTAWGTYTNTNATTSGTGWY